MKILLIGEYSGVHNNLKTALISLGHEVVLMGDSDGFKGFDFDFPIAPHYGSLFSKAKNILYILSKLPFLYKFEIIQIINPFIFPLHYFYTGIFYLMLLRARRVIYYACGTDPASQRKAAQTVWAKFALASKNSQMHGIRACGVIMLMLMLMWMLASKCLSALSCLSVLMCLRLSLSLSMWM